MKYIDWSSEKNEWLKDARGVSFEMVIEAILGEDFLVELEHPNKKKYANQRLYIVDLHGYAYAVPCIEDEEKIFLKTIYPSRKYTRKYIKKGGI